MKKELRVDILKEATSGTGVVIENPVFISDTDRSGLMKLVNQTFAGIVNLSNDITHYSPYTVASNMVCSVASGAITGGSAFLRMIADGSHTPDFSAFKKVDGSSTWDTTLNTVHLVSFGYDGVDAWYRIVVEAS